MVAAATVVVAEVEGMITGTMAAASSIRSVTSKLYGIKSLKEVFGFLFYFYAL